MSDVRKWALPPRVGAPQPSRFLSFSSSVSLFEKNSKFLLLRSPLLLFIRNFRVDQILFELDVVLQTDLPHDLLIRRHELPHPGVLPGLRVRLGIVNRNLLFDGVGVESPEAFDQMQRVGNGMT